MGQVGLTTTGRRRTPGLRREEVALLAGVSTDYYIRLEQGRERRPSDQVLHALAQVLQLDDEASAHLYRLAHPSSYDLQASRPSDEVGANILRLIGRWDDVVAFVVNHRLDVLSRNVAATALYGAMEHRENLLRLVFLNPDSRAFYRNWEEDAISKVAHARAVASLGHRDRATHELVGELSLKSEDFRSMWARHDVRVEARQNIYLHHPEVGDVILLHETLSVDSAPGLRVFTGQTEPGSSSEAAIANLVDRYQ